MLLLVHCCQYDAAELFNYTPETIWLQKHPRLQWVRICSLGGGFTFAAVRCSAVVLLLCWTWTCWVCPVLLTTVCLLLCFRQTGIFGRGVFGSSPRNCRTLGHLQCRSLYIANRRERERERDRGETETVNGIGAILKLETSRRVMGIHNALLQLFWATLELLWC